MKENRNHTKKTVNYSIDKVILAEFNKMAKEKSINRSGLFQKFIEIWIEEQKRKDIK